MINQTKLQQSNTAQALDNKVILQLWKQGWNYQTG